MFIIDIGASDNQITSQYPADWRWTRFERTC